MKRNHRQTRTFLMGMVTMLLLVSLSVTALAAYNRTLSVTYSDIKLQINGSMVTPKDANGSTVEPFIYQGTTYLPVRAVANALGCRVDWNQSSQTVIIEQAAPGGSTSGGNTSSGGSTGAAAVNMISNEMEPFGKDNATLYKYGGADILTMGGTNYKSAIRFYIGGGPAAKAFASFNLGGKYQMVTASLGTEDGANPGANGKNVVVNFYGDGNLLKSVDMSYGSLPTNISIDVTGVSEFKIEVPHIGGGYPYVGLGDMKLQ